MTLFKKVLRDLKENAAQFAAIFVMTVLALVISSGFDSSDVGGLSSCIEYFEETNFKDLDVSGMEFTETDADRLRGMDSVAYVDGIYHSTGKTVLDEERLLVLSYIGSNDVSRMYLIEGEEYTPGASGVWVEDIFAKHMGISPGDFLSITSENVTFTEEVKGLIYSPEYVYYVPNSSYTEPEYGTHGFCIMDIGEAPGTRVYYDQLVIDLKDVVHQGKDITDEEKSLMRSMRGRIQRKLESDRLLVRIKTEDDGYDAYVGSTDGNAAMSVMFPTIFLAVALLGILSTMTRLTAKQRTQIGTLKALGFSRAKITSLYLSYSSIITLIACVCGGIIGRFTLGQYLNDMGAYYYQTPNLRLQNSMKVVWMTVAAVGLCLLVNYMCTRKLLVQSAADILRPEAPKGDKSGRFEHSRLWDKLKFATRWNIRDVAKNRLRTIMSILGIIVCSMLLFVAVGFYECLRGQSSWMYGELIDAEYRITFNETASYGLVYDYAREFAGQMIEETDATVYGSDTDSVRLFTVIGEGNLFRIEDEDFKYADLPDNGCVFTSRLADTMGLGEGDIVRWKVAGDDKIYSARISLITRQATDQGIVIRRDVWENMGGEFVPNMVFTNKTVPLAYKSRPGISAINTTDELKELLERSTSTGYAATAIIIVMAVLMGVVVLYNLGILSYSEKIREIATMKVLGFQTKDIRFILMQQNLVVTALGAILGIPLGRAALDLLLDLYMGDSEDMAVRLSPLPFLLAIVGTFAVSALVNLYVTSRVRSVNMADSLKGVE